MSVLSLKRLRPGRRLAIAVFALGLSAAAVALHGHVSETIDTIATERALSARLAANLDAASVTLSAKGAPARKLMLDAATPTLAAVQLQAHVNSLVQEAGLERFRSARPQPPVERNGVPLIGIELTLATEIAGLQRLLTRIEASRPLLLIDALSIVPAPVAIAETGRRASQILEVRLTVLAAMATTNAAVRAQVQTKEVANVPVRRP